MKISTRIFTVFLLCLTGTSVFAQLAKCKGKYLGNIIQSNPGINYNNYWNQVTSENGSKWGSVEKTLGNYNWTTSDAAYNWAKNNGGLFKYHNFVWGSQTPNWVSGASVATITTAVENYIKACATHYAPMGGIKMIDVVNEPVNTALASNYKAALTAGYQAEPANASDKNNPYGWVIWSFQLARKYFPDATLLINEYNIEMNWNNCRAPYIDIVNAVKNAPNITDGKKNLIDGVGLQCHGIENLTAANFKACIDEIWNKTGIPIHITEFDTPADPNEAKQKSVYSTLIPVAWEHPHVAGITLWGYIQGTTWINGNGTQGASGTDSGIMYANGTERPALTWLKSYMNSQPSLPCCPAPAPFASCANAGPSVIITTPSDDTTFVAGNNITISATATAPNGTIVNVKFYNGNTLLSTDNTDPYSYTWNNVLAGNYTLKAVVSDDQGNMAQDSIPIKVNVPQGPYNGVVHLIPGRIEAEEYDLGGEGQASHEVNTNGNEGGATFRNDEVDIETTEDINGNYDVGYILQGEWLEYTVDVLVTDDYDLDLRVAEDGDGKVFHIEIDGIDVTGSINVPNTGGWQAWQTITVNSVGLTQGQHVMRIAFDANYINLNYVEFKGTITGMNTGMSSVVNEVYPNPFTGNGIQINQTGDFNYKITDMSGAVLESGKGSNSGRTVGVNLNPGIYFLTIESASGVFRHKIVKQ